VATNAKTWPIAIITGVLALLVGAVGTYALRSALDDDNGDGPELTVRLEPADFAGDDPFSTEPFAPPPDPTMASTERVLAATVSLNSTIEMPTPSAPGLYGGSNSDFCLVEPMIEFYAADPDKTKAWVEAQNDDRLLRWDRGTLTEEDLPEYLRSLTPATLQNDTFVTNHGVPDGNSVPIVSLLQRGTTVLVDEYGVARAKCYSGNPLTLAPEIVGQTKLDGEGWPGVGEGSSNPKAEDGDQKIDELQTCELLRRTFSAGVTTSPERCERNTGDANRAEEEGDLGEIELEASPSGIADETDDLGSEGEGGSAVPIPVETCADNNWPADWLDSEASDRTGFLEVQQFDLTIVNTTGDDIQFVQHGYDCSQIGPNFLPAGATWEFGTMSVGIPLTAATVDGQVLSEFQMPLSDATWTIGG
jgi:hypothetical protein